jgi:hypothetical protein
MGTKPDGSWVSLPSALGTWRLKGSPWLQPGMWRMWKETVVVSFKVKSDHLRVVLGNTTRNCHNSRSSRQCVPCKLCMWEAAVPHTSLIPPRTDNDSHVVRYGLFFFKSVPPPQAHVLFSRHHALRTGIPWRTGFIAPSTGMVFCPFTTMPYWDVVYCLMGKCLWLIRWKSGEVTVCQCAREIFWRKCCVNSCMLFISPKVK